MRAGAACECLRRDLKIAVFYVFLIRHVVARASADEIAASTQEVK